MIKVSVLIPVYNTEKYLEQCLISVEKQTLKDLEIICINDGSTDQSLQIIKEHQSKDPRIKIIDKQNTGYGHSMNQGLKSATGEYIGVVESDDFADEKMFEYLYSIAKTHDVEIVKSNYWHHYGQGSDGYCEMLEGCPYDKVTSLQETPELYFKNTNLWSSIYRKDFLLKHDIWFNETPGASYQDVAFTLKTLACATKIYLVNEAFLHYRMDSVGSSINSREKVYCDCDEFAEMWRFLERRPSLKDKVKYLLPRTMLRIYQWNYNRIHERFRDEFLQHVVCEFQGFQKGGLLRKEFWDDASWSVMQRLLQTPARLEYESHSVEQFSQFLTNGFLMNLKLIKKIYVFGAGKVGKEMLGWLSNHGISVSGVLVSETDSNPNMLMGSHVRLLTDVLPSEDSGIILSIGELAQYDVLHRLKEMGWTHVFVASNALRKGLRLL